VYSFLISILTGAYFVTIYLLERGIQGLAGYQSIPLTVAIIACFSLIFTPLRNRIQSIVDRYFFKGTIDQIEKEKAMLEIAIQRSEKLKAVSTLAAGMAHEIKNPLTSLKTFTEYVSSKYDDPEFRSKFSKIVPHEIEKIQNIVNQLLKYSTTEKTDLRKHDIHMILDYVLDLYSNEFLKKDISVEKEYFPGQGDVVCDENQIKQVFINLVLNSIEAIPQGGIIKVGTRRKDEIVEITIEDTGKGISPDKLKHLFDAFYTTKDEGTGLGLFVVHQIIENNNGKILIDSELNKGTTVKVVLSSV